MLLTFARWLLFAGGSCLRVYCAVPLSMAQISMAQVSTAQGLHKNY